MSTSRITISIDNQLLARVDAMVKARRYPNRSSAFQSAVELKIGRSNEGRLARECAKLNPVEERAMAEEAMGVDSELWPEY